MASLIQKLSLHIIFYLLVVILECNYSETTKPKKYIRAIHIDSPKSPMYQPELTKFERIKRLGAISEAQMHHIAEETTNMARYHELEVTSPKLKSQDFQYYVEVGLGVFSNGEPHKNYLGLNIGARLTWTQCEGCRHCFKQSSPLFPKDKSETYRPYGKDDCPGYWVGTFCNGRQAYANGVDVRGVWSRDTLTMPGVDPHSEDVIKDFTFLCGYDAILFRKDYPNNVITGMLGMGHGKYSLMSQWGKNKFSYCIQEAEFGIGYEESEMLLRFGDNIEEPQNMFVTPLLKVANHAYYYLKLHDISVNGVKLNIPQDFFTTKPDVKLGNKGGTMISASSPYTFLVPEAYTILEDAITKFITENSFYLTKCPDPSVIKADACWVPTIDVDHVLPSVTFHFEGDADLFVKPSQLFWIVLPPSATLSPPTFYYLTIRPLPEGHINSIGTMHQYNHLMVFDVQNSKLSFAVADCADRD